eukprot:GSMAST32.ASY1.ANO1.2753.1 assembled CDS
MAAKYGAPGKTDSDGFNPYADAVGAGIYGGTVQRSANGAIVIGRQYQNHNPRPGPVYSNGGYSPISIALQSFHSKSSHLKALLEKYPDLVNDTSTGGALPLHNCGMSQRNQLATSFIVSHGGDIEAVDTYGFTPLHRMASNNLPIGTKALLDAGASPIGLPGLNTPTPLQIARESRAEAVISILETFGNKRKVDNTTLVSSITIFTASYPAIIGKYSRRDGRTEIPKGFVSVCHENQWNPSTTWKKLNGGENLTWFAHEDNDSYIYFNKSDGCWWIDGPDGLGAYKAKGPAYAPPCGQIRWDGLKGNETNVGPVLAVYRGIDE